jgi:hypothetical protein
LFKDKEGMLKGQVTEFAKKKFKEGNQNVDEYLKAMNMQLAADLKGAPKDLKVSLKL